MDNNRKSRKISLGFLDNDLTTNDNVLLDKLLKKKNAFPPQNLFYSPTPVQKQIKLPTLFFKGKTSGNAEANIQKNVTQQNENSSQNWRTLGNFTNFCPNVVSTPAPVVVANQQGFNNSLNSSSANISSNGQFELAEYGVESLTNSSRIEIENNEFSRNIILQNMRLDKSNSLNNINQKQRQTMIDHNHIDLNPSNENSEKENENVQHSRNMQSKNITHNQTIENSNKDNDVNKNLNSDKRNSKSITFKTIILDEELNGNNEEEVVAVVNHNNDVDNNVDELRNENINMIFRDNTLKTNDKKQSSRIIKNIQKEIVQKIPNTITTTTITNSSNKNLNIKPQSKNSSAANKISNHVEENLIPSTINNDANEKDNNILFNIQSNPTINKNDICRTAIRSTLDKNRASNMIALQTYSNELNEILSQVNGDNEDFVEEVLPDSQPKWLLSVIENKRMNTMNNFKEPKSKLSNRRRKTKQNVDPIKERYLQTTNNILQNKAKLCINSICSNSSNNNTNATDRCGKRVLHTKGRSQEPENGKQQCNNNDKECNFDVQLISNQEESSANRKNTTTTRSSLSLPPPSSPPQSSSSPSLLESDDKQSATTEIQVRMEKLTRSSAKNSNRNRSNENKRNSELDENEFEPKAKKKYNERQKSINKKNIPKTVTKHTKNNEKQRQQASNIQNDCPEMTTDETTSLRRSKRERKGLTAYWLNDKPPITETDIWQKLYNPLIENESKKNKNVNSLSKKTIASTSTRNESSSRNRNKKSSKSQKNHLDVVIEENINENEIQIDNDRTLVNEEIMESTDIIEATEIIKDNCNNSQTIINNNPVENVENIETECLNGLNVVNLYKNINFNPVVRIKRIRTIINSDSGACGNDEPVKQNPQQNQQQKQQRQEQQQNQDYHDHQTETINDVDHNNSENSNFNNEIWINNFIKRDWEGVGQVFQQIVTVRNAFKVSAKHLCFVEHENVEYAYYQNDAGYIRIRPNKEKKYSGANKYPLKMFILAGNVDFYFNDTILAVKDGDYIDIEKGAYYKIKNDSTEIALILFVICK